MGGGAAALHLDLRNLLLQLIRKGLPMADDRFMVANLEIWGNLVKTWATGVDHVQSTTSKTYLKQPETIDELRALLADLGVGAILPARYTKLNMVPAPEDTLVIKLPEKKALEAAQAELEAGFGYQPPDIYKDFFGAHDLPPASSDDDRKEQVKVHAMSIGDYTIRNCR